MNLLATAIVLSLVLGSASESFAYDIILTLSCETSSATIKVFDNLSNGVPADSSVFALIKESGKPERRIEKGHFNYQGDDKNRYSFQDRDQKRVYNDCRLRQRETVSPGEQPWSNAGSPIGIVQPKAKPKPGKGSL